MISTSGRFFEGGRCRPALVINFSVPTNRETFVLQSARFGRFGLEPVTITFVASADEKQELREIENFFAVQIAELPMNFADHL